MIFDGDNPYDALVNGIYEMTCPENLNRSILAYEPLGGMRLLSGYMLDVHFSQRGRQARLVKALQLTRNVAGKGATKAIAIDENTALVVENLYNRPVGTVVSSAGSVFLVDIENLVVNPSNSTDYENALFSALTVDDTIDLSTG